MTRVLTIFLLSALALFTCFSLLGAPPETTGVKFVPARPSVSIEGKVLFREYCAACHGVDAKGNGPAAFGLVRHPTDLTQMSSRHNGKFPDDYLMRVLRGEEKITSHGKQEMPAWASTFYRMNSSLNVAQTQIFGLVNYIERIQAK
ncbi:MAG TPA: cytochrome c [Bryobacteraceae bacterium]|nr:cytochrome c [Bryobacteraceae bacterium]